MMSRFNKFLLIAICFEIVITACAFRNWAGGDVGVYSAVAYQVTQNRIPFVDFAWAQGAALPYVMGLYVLLAGPAMLSLQIFTVMFSILTLWLLVTLADRILSANVPDKVSAGKGVLLTVLFCSPYFWWFMAGIDSKTSYTGFLLLMSCYLAYLAVNGSHRSYALAASGLLLGVLVASKYTFASIVPCLVGYVAYYSGGKRPQALAIVSMAFVAGFGMFLLPVFYAVGLQDGVSLVASNLEFMVQDYGMRGTTWIQGIYDSGTLIRTWLLFVAGCFPFLFVYITKPLNIRKLLEPRNSVLVLLFSCGVVYFAANFVALFPTIFFSHYAITFVFFVIPIMLWGYVLEAGDGESTHLNLRGLVAVALFAAVPQSALAISERMTPLWPSDYAYEVLGRSQMVDELNRLALDGLPSGEMATDYLYVGLAMNSLLTSDLTLSAYSSEGNTYMDGHADVDRETANRIKVLTMPNFDDLLQQHNVVVIAHQRLEQATERSRSQLQEMREQLDNARFERLFSDERNELYTKG